MVCSIGNTLGKFGISGLELSTNQQINSVVCDGNTILPRFCLFFVSVLTVDLIKWTNFVTLPIFTKSDFENTEIVVPPLSEQNEIVSYLDEHTQLIDKTISVEERRIELLKEYRQSLISEVVTGKRKVVN
jgi:type I restriction enzyme S subunit